jgi:alkanesulfonate monooxygenase SsuD/methylene tetrahydromethanopterin reductase-like flavin-dependent oxidoreductase (luciferase family)
VKAAEYAANLDILTNGNYICAVALGYRDVEFDSIGISKKERVGRLIEGLEAMRILWTEESASFDGKYYSFDDVTLNPKPVRDGGPPIWIGANTDTAVRRAARLGDAWFINPHARMETIRSQLTVYEDELEQHGKSLDDVTLPLYREALIAEDTETAIRNAAPHLTEKYDKYVDWGQSEAMGDSGDLLKEFEDLLEDRFILGTPEQAREEIQRYRDELGIDHLVLRMYWPDMPEEHCVKSIRLFGEEVIPHFK